MQKPNLQVDFKEDKFSLGRIVMTRGVDRKFNGDHGAMFDYLRRHADGDWGDLGYHDQALNNAALRDGTRLLSSYKLPTEHGGGKMYIITEWDRSVTTLLLPEEY